MAQCERRHDQHEHGQDLHCGDKRLEPSDLAGAGRAGGHDQCPDPDGAQQRECNYLCRCFRVPMIVEAMFVGTLCLDAAASG
jgi:hypothetical protein